MPNAAAFLARNLCGVCTRMPAPSPARGSAPTAPRCSRLRRIVSASSTILCDLRPLISAIKPTPQESFSSAGSNKPKPDASIVHALLAGPLERAASRVPRNSPCSGPCRPAPGRATHLGGNLRTAQLAARLLVLATVGRALATRQLIRASRRDPVRPRTLGSSSGTAMLSYAEHDKLPPPTQAARPKNGGKGLGSAVQVDHETRESAMLSCWR